MYKKLFSTAFEPHAFSVQGLKNLKLGQFIFSITLTSMNVCAALRNYVFSTEKDAFARKIRVASLSNQNQPWKADFGSFIVGSERHHKKMSEDGMGGVYSLQALKPPQALPSLVFWATPPVSLCHWHAAARAPQNQLLLERGTAHMKTRPPRPRFKLLWKDAKEMDDERFVLRCNNRYMCL